MIVWEKILKLEIALFNTMFNIKFVFGFLKPFPFTNKNNIYFRHALTAATGILEGVKRANSFGTEIGQEIAKYGFGGLIDIQVDLN